MSRETESEDGLLSRPGGGEGAFINKLQLCFDTILRSGLTANGNHRYWHYNKGGEGECDVTGKFCLGRI